MLEKGDLSDVPLHARTFFFLCRVSAASDIVEGVAKTARAVLRLELLLAVDGLTELLLQQ